MRPFIVVGDNTDHGGTVLTGSAVTDAAGKLVAKVGDNVSCPRRGHGPAVIVSGDPTLIVAGQPVARHGDKCSRGATLLSSQIAVFTEDRSGATNAGAATGPGGAMSRPVAAGARSTCRR